MIKTTTYDFNNRRLIVTLSREGGIGVELWSGSSSDQCQWKFSDMPDAFASRFVEYVLNQLKNEEEEKDE